MRWPSATQWKNSTVLIKSVKLFTRNASASVAVIFALMSAVLFLICACAIDYGRLLIVHDRLQNALDSAVQRAAADTEAPDKIALANEFFDAANGILVEDAQATFAIDAATNSLTGRSTKQIPMTLASFFIQSVDVGVSASAKLPRSAALDLVLCIDSTQGMGKTLNVIKANSLNLRDRLEAEMAQKGVPSFDQIRVRYIYFKDYGGFATDNAMNATKDAGWNYILVPYELKYSMSTSNGDQVPLNASDLYTLPDQSAPLSAFTDYGLESGGSVTVQADSGLECLNEAMNTAFVKVGDKVSGKTLSIAIPVIAIYTNKAAHPPGYIFSIFNPSYPKDMPRDYNGLKAKWADASKIDQPGKLMLFFGAPSQIHGGLQMPYSGTTYASLNPFGQQDEYGNFLPLYNNAWTAIQSWPAFQNPAGLDSIQTDFISKLATSISFQYAKLASR